MEDLGKPWVAGWLKKTVGKCADCGSVYALRKTKNGELFPGGSGECFDCGCTEFIPLS